ncbi:hypothetical protein CAEBREN_32839 [Caenorhabditis brenneri]|uniref:Nanos-type domain-containing protein n=1 Tax=Caenorhabditis brenneri TaxID=135651 RepID=G0N9Q2_CAEBE|nr:hypothetical protein CAEBREN_32839 [Caenorhabditis brenneri]
MSLDTPSNFSSSDTSDEFDDDVLYFIEDEPFRFETPLPTFDAFEHDMANNELVEFGTSLFPLTPISDSQRRPDTSTSSIFSFITETRKTPPPAESLRLPTFVAPENSSFFGSESDSEVKLFTQFRDWMYKCSPRGTFASVSAEEIEKNPREIRTTHGLPSLFKRREYGCGYCRSTGVMRWESHTKRNCAQLRALAPCKICGASGEMNHTETYCPMKPSVNLSLEKEFEETSENESFQRSRQHFHKYSKWINMIYSSSD